MVNTPYVGEIWANTMLQNLRPSVGGFGARIVNRNFQSPGGTKADVVNAFRPLRDSVGTGLDTDLSSDAMPTFADVNSEIVRIPLERYLRYAVGIPFSVTLKSEHDIIRGYELICADTMVDQRNRILKLKLDENTDIPVVAGTTASPVTINKTNVIDFINEFHVRLMKNGAIMNNGQYRFVDTETQENVAYTGHPSQELETPGEAGQEAPGVLGSQVKTALPVLAVPSKIYSLIKAVQTKAGALTQEREFYGNVPIIGGFELVLDEGLDKGDYLQMYAGTRNLITEALTNGEHEIYSDPNRYRRILRGFMCYGAEVVNPDCGAVGYFTLA